MFRGHPSNRLNKMKGGPQSFKLRLKMSHGMGHGGFLQKKKGEARLSFQMDREDIQDRERRSESFTAFTGRAGQGPETALLFRQQVAKKIVFPARKDFQNDRQGLFHNQRDERYAARMITTIATTRKIKN